MKILGGAFNPDAREKLPAFIAQFKPNFPVGLVDQMFVGNYAQLQTLNGRIPKVPIMLFIDRAGMIRSQYFGDDKLFDGDLGKNIRAEIDKLLSEAPPKSASAAKKK